MNSLQLKRTTLSFIASRIPEDEIKKLRMAFSKMDANGDGQLSIAELTDGVKDISGLKIGIEDLTKAL